MLFRSNQILRESLRPLGYEVEAEAEDEDEPEPAAGKGKKKKAKRKAAPAYPIKAVQFANFIIQ